MKRPAKSKYEPDTKIKKRNLAFYDLEFTGLNFDHEVIEIGCVLVSQPDYKIIKKWLVKIKPSHIENADKNSLRIVEYSEEKWKNALSLKKALNEFNRIAKEAVLVGYNSVWDFMFLKKAYYEAGLDPAFHWQNLDVLPMAFTLLNGENIKGFRMVEVANFLKIKKLHWHNPLDDAMITYEIFIKLLEYKNKKYGQ